MSTNQVDSDSPDTPESTHGGQATPAETPTPEAPLSEVIRSLSDRWCRDGRWQTVQPVRDQMMKECRAKGMSKEDARAWTYRELDRLYPPLPPPPEPPVESEPAEPAEAISVTEIVEGDSNSTQESATKGNPRSSDEIASRTRESHLQGLDQIPSDWPELPSNAALQAELSWVQAERLRIVEERPSGATVVHLDRAGSPAPSWAALGWLETSIRSYAKYVDICAKGLASQELESDMVRRERRSIEDVRRILQETLDALDAHK